MSIATENISRLTTFMLRQVEIDARKIAKEHGVKIRRHQYSGINVKFPNGEKKHYWGWMQVRNDLAKSFDLYD